MRKTVVLLSLFSIAMFSKSNAAGSIAHEVHNLVGFPLCEMVVEELRASTPDFVPQITFKTIRNNFFGTRRLGVFTKMPLVDEHGDLPALRERMIECWEKADSDDFIDQDIEITYRDYFRKNLTAIYRYLYGKSYNGRLFKKEKFRELLSSWVHGSFVESANAWGEDRPDASCPQGVIERLVTGLCRIDEISPLEAPVKRALAIAMASKHMMSVSRATYANQFVRYVYDFEMALEPEEGPDERFESLLESFTEGVIKDALGDLRDDEDAFNAIANAQCKNVDYRVYNHLARAYADRVDGPEVVSARKQFMLYVKDMVAEGILDRDEILADLDAQYEAGHRVGSQFRPADLPAPAVDAAAAIPEDDLVPSAAASSEQPLFIYGF